MEKIKEKSFPLKVCKGKRRMNKKRKQKIWKKI